MRKRVFYINYSDYISIEDWWALNQQLEDVSRLLLGKVVQENVQEVSYHSPRSSIKQSWLAKLFNYLKAKLVLGNVKEELASFLVKAVTVRRSDLHDYFITKTNNLAGTLVSDFDWSVKVSC